MVEIFKYSNYRTFIKDYYFARKSKHPSFSYRVLARRAEINSSSYFKNLIEGQRNLSLKTLEKVGKALGLSGLELEYFRNLVQFNQATTAKEKSKFFINLTKLRNRYETKIVEPKDYEFYSEWYHPVVRELVVVPGLENPKKISKSLQPEVSPAKVTASIRLLESLGFIYKKPDGSYVQSEPVLSTGTEIRHGAIIAYQIKMFEMSLATLQQAKAGTYMASSTTLGFTLKGMEKAKSIIRNCRSELLQEASREKKIQGVYQLNIHLFPLGKIQVKGSSHEDN